MSSAGQSINLNVQRRQPPTCNFFRQRGNSRRCDALSFLLAIHRECYAINLNTNYKAANNLELLENIIKLANSNNRQANMHIVYSQNKLIRLIL